MERREFVFLESLVRFIEAKTIIEVGVQVGDMAVHLCRAAKQNGGKYFGFDIWSRHGLDGQFNQAGSKQSVSKRLDGDYTLTQVDTINNQKGFEGMLKQQCPNGINFAFIDACHSYLGIANDFFTVYPMLSKCGVIAFHDTLMIDGCREFAHDLRTKYNDGTFDIVDFPFGIGSKRCGITLLSKRSFPILNIGITEVCGAPSRPKEIEENEEQWYKEEIKDKPEMPRTFKDTIHTDRLGMCNKRKKYE